MSKTLPAAPSKAGELLWPTASLLGLVPGKRGRPAVCSQPAVPRQQPPCYPPGSQAWGLSEALQCFHRLVFVQHFGTMSQLKLSVCPAQDWRSTRNSTAAPALCLLGSLPAAHPVLCRQVGLKWVFSRAFQQYPCNSWNALVFIHVRINIFIRSTCWLVLFDDQPAFAKTIPSGRVKGAASEHGWAQKAHSAPRVPVPKCTNPQALPSCWYSCLLIWSYYSWQKLYFGGRTAFSLSVCSVPWSCTLHYSH